MLRFFQCLAIFASLLAGYRIFEILSHEPGASKQLLVQNTYFGPNGTSQDDRLVRIEISVKDSPRLGGVRVRNVSFDGTYIPLKNPPDIYGHRGVGSFQVLPGKYTLRWTVDRDARIWPRTVNHEEIVHVNPRDMWVQIVIEGDTASIR